MGIMAMADLSIAVFASGGGSNLQALIDAVKCGHIRGKINAVISNNSSAIALQRAETEHIANYHISSKKYPDPADLLAELDSILDGHSINLIVLAGYMKLLPLEIVRRFKGRIINIHPALLPRFGGRGMYGINVHKAVIEAGEKLSGATVHFVDEIYDNGAIIIQRTVPVLPDDTPETLAARVLEIEHKILPEAVSLFL
jgi:phosphoribosylglycinamide formyltransferase 1